MSLKIQERTAIQTTKRNISSGLHDGLFSSH